MNYPSPSVGSLLPAQHNGKVVAINLMKAGERKTKDFLSVGKHFRVPDDAVTDIYNKNDCVRANQSGIKRRLNQSLRCRIVGSGSLLTVQLISIVNGDRILR